MSLVTSLAKVGGFTIISRVMGFIRDLVLARLFGADAATDAFFVAFKIPNLFRRIFAEGAFSAAFVPVLTEYKETRDYQDLKTFIDHVAGTLGVVLLAVSLIGVLLAPWLIAIIAPGWVFGGSGNAGLAADMLQLTFPYLFFISLTAFSAGILNTYDRFSVPAFTPVLLNLCLIAAAYWLSPLFESQPVMGLAWGVFIAGIAQLAFQLPFLHQIKLLPKPGIRFRDEGVMRVIRLMAPSVFGASASQIGLLLNTLIASLLVEGSISWLYYSDRLLEFPVGIIGAALAVVVLPNLSKKYQTSTREAFSELIDWGVRWALILGLPAAVALFVLAGPMISTLFQSDRFNTEDVLMSTASLRVYALAVLPFLLVKVFAPGFYAREDTKTPVRAAIIAIIANLAVSASLFSILGHIGLATATVVSSLINAGILLYYLHVRDRAYLFPLGWAVLISKVMLAAFFMALCFYLMSGSLDYWLESKTLTKITWLAVILVAGALVYGTSLLIMGVRPRHLRGQKPAQPID